MKAKLFEIEGIIKDERRLGYFGDMRLKKRRITVKQDDRKTQCQLEKTWRESRNGSKIWSFSLKWKSDSE